MNNTIIKVEKTFDFGKKKAKKKLEVVREVKSDEVKLDEEPQYTYEFLLGRIFDLIGNGEILKHTIKPPQVFREGTRKTIWANFQETCTTLNRQPEHVLTFFLSEVGTTGSIDGNGRFVIKGRFQPNQIETILKKYIHEYVKCHTCKTSHTNLKRENRLLFMICEKCGSSRTVTPIKTGFLATTRDTKKMIKL